MTNEPQLCLGTVQFGLPYGVTNRGGKVPEGEVSRIMNLAASSGIELLDTAQAYGTAETVLGRCWPTGAPRRLISKLPAGAPRQSWEESLITSLQRLQSPKLDGFLLHRASDLLSPDGGALLNWLESLRDRGLVERIGVSIYDVSELDGLPLNRLQIVQLPLSVYDQRLIQNGTLRMLQDLNLAVHVRSVFLQGLVLQDPRHWPKHFSSAFREHHAQWLNYLRQKKKSPLAGALGFVRACQGVEAVLVGVVAGQEMAEVLQVWDEAKNCAIESQEHWAWDNELDLDPRRWEH
jgi:aryl-alcohol dehydrogenase-like predicted oxidoreductase